MGIFKKDEMLLDFKGIHTEDISSTVPYMNKLNNDARNLVNQLNPNTVNNKRFVMFNESEQFDLYKLFEKSTTLNNNDNNFSETSPFISSDVYNQLLHKIKSNNQSGGAILKGKGKGKGKKGKSKKTESSEEYMPRNEDHDDESSTSSSSSSSSDSDLDKTSNLKYLFKKAKKNDSDSHNIDLDDHDNDENDFSMSAGSYLSSSAHTNGSNSDNTDSDNTDSNNTDSNNNSNNSNNSNSYNSDSYKSNSFASSTVSSKYHKRRSNNYSDSVNTSDINIMSVDE